jgi:hypothetical protein
MIRACTHKSRSNIRFQEKRIFATKSSAFHLRTGGLTASARSDDND